MVANDPQPPFRGIDWDDSLEQTPRAVEALARGQLRVERWLAHHARTKILALRIIGGSLRVFTVNSSLRCFLTLLVGCVARAPGTFHGIALSGFFEVHHTNVCQTSVFSFVTL